MRARIVANRETEQLYRSFAFIDEVIGVDKYSDFMGMLDDLQLKMNRAAETPARLAPEG